MPTPRIIAFYLPQYYATDTNDKWFGKGFTEWTNVGKARSLFRGHYQPRVPADLGYYDLRYPEIREMQAQLARDAGIEGFCYYHYWFGNGDMELDVPFKEVVRLKQPDFPFCLCWANQSWYSKFWNKDAECEHRLIKEQRYDDCEGIRCHFMSLLEAFSDSRYIKVDGRLLFMIYRPNEYPGVVEFMNEWRKLAKEKLSAGFYFVAQATNDEQAKSYLEMGFDGVNILRKDAYLSHFYYNNALRKYISKAIRLFGGAPYHVDYAKISKYFVNEDGIERKPNIFPTLIPNWDHSPRSGKRGQVFTNSTPPNFEIHLQKAMRAIADKPSELQIMFLKSWNEWGEGNYIEPDLRYGNGFLDVIKAVVKK